MTTESKETSLPSEKKAAAQLVPPKKVFVETWGCQMNVADSESMLAILEKKNYIPTTNEEDADLIVLNTCTIREKAKHKALSRLGRFHKLKQKNPALKIGMGGCLPQSEGKQAMDKIKSLDFVFGPGKIHEIGDLVEQDRGAVALGFGAKNVETTKQRDVIFAREQSGQVKPVVDGKNVVSRYINISQGCNNFCTFCVVPRTRGQEISREPEDILTEIQAMVEAGTKEVTLLGQNVNSYGFDLESEPKDSRLPLTRLIEAIAEKTTLERLRYTTSNPHDFTQDLAEAYRLYRPMLGNYLHLPVQSGSDPILEAMRRKVTVAEFYEKVNWLRQFDPHFSLSTDIIVGFPGESAEDFEQTLELIKKVRFSFVFAFAYSQRKATPAAKMLHQIPEEEKRKRLHALNKVQGEISLELNSAAIGQKVPVLFTYKSQKEPGTFCGKTPCFKLVKVKSSQDIVGQTRWCEIKKARLTSVDAVLLKP